MVHIRREVITLNRNVPIVIKGVLHKHLRRDLEKEISVVALPDKILFPI